MQANTCMSSVPLIVTSDGQRTPERAKDSDLNQARRENDCHRMSSCCSTPVSQLDEFMSPDCLLLSWLWVIGRMGPCEAMVVACIPFAQALG